MTSSMCLPSTSALPIIEGFRRVPLSEFTAISGQVSDWADCSGQITAQNRAGVALFPYPSAANAPWFVADWGTMGVNPFVRERKMMNCGETLDVAMRVVVHDGDAEEARMTELYRAFIQELRD